MLAFDISAYDGPRSFAKGKPIVRPESNAVSEILPWLFVGSAEAANQVGLLRSLGIRNVVNCTSMRPFYPKEFAHHSIEVEDSPRADIAAHFDEAVRWVRSRYGNVLIYCAKGVSRSCTVTLAVLMHTASLDLWQAWQLVKRKRPKCRPNAGFLAQLEAYERRIRGSNSVAIVDDTFLSREEATAIAAAASSKAAAEAEAAAMEADSAATAPRTGEKAAMARNSKKATAGAAGVAGASSSYKPAAVAPGAANKAGAQRTKKKKKKRPAR
jgi:hypothetical protein